MYYLYTWIPRVLIGFEDVGSGSSVQYVRLHAWCEVNKGAADPHEVAPIHTSQQYSAQAIPKSCHLYTLSPAPKLETLAHNIHDAVPLYGLQKSLSSWMLRDEGSDDSPNGSCVLND